MATYGPLSRERGSGEEPNEDSEEERRRLENLRTRKITIYRGCLGEVMDIFNLKNDGWMVWSDRFDLDARGSGGEI